MYSFKVFFVRNILKISTALAFLGVVSRQALAQALDLSSISDSMSYYGVFEPVSKFETIKNYAFLSLYFLFLPMILLLGGIFAHRAYKKKKIKLIEKK